MNNFLSNAFVLVLSIVVGSNVALGRDRLAKNKKSSTDQKGFRDTDPVKGNPHPIGKDKIVRGIVITSVVGGIGAGLVSFGLVNFCTSTSYDDEGNGTTETDESCKKRNQQMMLGGAAVVAIGLGIGLPIMFKGMEERRVWKQWNRSNSKFNRQAEYQTISTYEVFLTSVPAVRNSVALGLNYTH